MSRSTKRSASLADLPAYDAKTGDVTVVVETPKGSHNKYRYDPDCRALRLSAVLGEGLAFPYDFGFVPSTLGEDGDPLDVLLFLDHAVPPGCVATAVPQLSQNLAAGEHVRAGDRVRLAWDPAHTFGLDGAEEIDAGIEGEIKALDLRGAGDASAVTAGSTPSAAGSPVGG